MLVMPLNLQLQLVVDFLNNVSSTLDGGNQFEDDLIGTLPNSFESIWKFDDTVGGVEHF